jgi:hypothetical protein
MMQGKIRNGPVFLCILQPEIILLKSYLTAKTCKGRVWKGGRENGFGFKGERHELSALRDVG